MGYELDNHCGGPRKAISATRGAVDGVLVFGRAALLAELEAIGDDAISDGSFLNDLQVIDAHINDSEPRRAAPVAPSVEICAGGIVVLRRPRYPSDPLLPGLVRSRKSTNLQCFMSKPLKRRRHAIVSCKSH